MIKEIKIIDLYYGYKECIEYHLNHMDTDPYLQQMVKDIDKLPPISVIDIGFYSLSDGYHRLAVYLYLGFKKIKIEVQ